MPKTSISMPNSPTSRTLWTLRRAITAALIAAPLVLGLLTQVSPALAQTVCADRHKVISELARHNAETPKAIGLSASGTLFELLVSPNGGWTILVTFPSHQTCLVATGDYWENIPVVATGPTA